MDRENLYAKFQASRTSISSCLGLAIRMTMSAEAAHIFGALTFAPACSRDSSENPDFNAMPCLRLLLCPY